MSKWKKLLKKVVGVTAAGSAFNALGGAKGIGQLGEKIAPYALGGLSGGFTYNMLRRARKTGRPNPVDTQDPGEIFSAALRKRTQQRQMAAGYGGRSSTVLGGAARTLLG